MYKFNWATFLNKNKLLYNILLTFCARVMLKLAGLKFNPNIDLTIVQDSIDQCY